MKRRSEILKKRLSNSLKQNKINRNSFNLLMNFIEEISYEFDEELEQSKESERSLLLNEYFDTNNKEDFSFLVKKFKIDALDEFDNNITIEKESNNKPFKVKIF